MCCGKNRQQFQMQSALRKGATALPRNNPVPAAPVAPVPANPYAGAAKIAARRPQFRSGPRPNAVPQVRPRMPIAPHPGLSPRG
jgi:hypothetical protein